MDLGSELKALSDVMKGSDVALHSIMAGRTLNQRLSTMGLVVGSRFRILHKSGQGRMVLLVGGSRLALGAGIASKLIVREN